METILTQLNIFREKIVHIMTNVSGLENTQAEILLIVILGYIVGLLLLVFIHRKIIKKHKNIHEHLIVLYDTLRYQIAKAQYENESMQNKKGIKIVIEAKQKNYLTNEKLIKEEILSIEQILGQQIISDDQRKKIHKETKKKTRTKRFLQFIGRFTTFITAGIYKLFW